MAVKENFEKSCQISFSGESRQESVRRCSRPVVKVCEGAGETVCRTEYETECTTRYYTAREIIIHIGGK